MEISRLKEFITLAALLNYSKAASRLYLTQPALSRHIHDPENQLGTTLFVRDTHSVRLTSVGELFYEEAKEIVARYDHAVALVKEATADTSGELKIGFLGTASQNFFADFVTVFTAGHPEIALSLFCGDMDSLTSQLNSGEADIGVVTTGQSHLHGLEQLNIRSFPLYAILHPSHSYADRESLSLADLSGLPFINFSSRLHPVAADFNKQLFKKSGAKMQVSEEISFIEEALFQVSINKGVFFIPEYLLCMVPDTLIRLPLTDPHCVIKLNLFWKKSNTNPSLPHFVKEFRTYIKNH